MNHDWSRYGNPAARAQWQQAGAAPAGTEAPAAPVAAPPRFGEGGNDLGLGGRPRAAHADASLAPRTAVLLDFGGTVRPLDDHATTQAAVSVPRPPRREASEPRPVGRGADQPPLAAEDKAFLDQFESAAAIEGRCVGNYRKEFRRLSQWISSQATDEERARGIGLASRLDDPGLANRFEQMDTRNACLAVSTTLDCLRTFKRTGQIHIKTVRDTSGIPSMDERLIGRLHELRTQQLNDKAKARPPRPSIPGKRKQRSDADIGVSHARALSEELRRQGKPGLASCLVAGTLNKEIDEFSAVPTVRSVLRRLCATIKPEHVVSVACGGVDPRWFVQALGTCAGGTGLDGLAERMASDDKATDLRQCFDETSFNGLTPLGSAYVATLPAGLKEQAERHLLEWALSRAGVSGQSAAVPLSPFDQPPSEGWPHFHLDSPLVDTGDAAASAASRRQIVEEDKSLLEDFTNAAKAQGVRQTTLNEYMVDFRRLSRWASNRATDEARAHGAGLASRLDDPRLAVEAQPAAVGTRILPGTLLECLRTFEKTGRVAIGTHRSTRGIPATDARLVERLSELLREQIAKKKEGLPPRPNPGPRDAPGSNVRNEADNCASQGRLFSSWLQDEGRPGLAVSLVAGTLQGDIAEFTKGNKRAQKVRAQLNRLCATIKPEDVVGVACKDIDPGCFVGALKDCAGGRGLDAVLEEMAPDQAAHLRQLLDEKSPNGLTALGSAYVATLRPDLKEQAEGHLGQRARTRAGAFDRAQAADAPAGLAQARAVPASPFDPTPSGGWPDFHLHSPLPDVTGPAHAPNRADAGVYSGLAPLTSLPSLSQGSQDWDTCSQEVTGPARDPQGSPARRAAARWRRGTGPAGASPAQPAGASLRPGVWDMPQSSPQRSATDSAWNSIEPLSGALFDLNTPDEEVTGPARSSDTDKATVSTPQIIDLENDQVGQKRKEASRQTAAQRLSGNGWLGDDDLMHCTRMAVQGIVEAMGPGMARQRYERLNQRLAIADAAQVSLLTGDDPVRRARVLSHLDAPVVLLPVNNANSHWSLLVVNRAERQAYHYDSMVAPDEARNATDTPQFARSLEVANALGVNEVLGRPTARQRDLHSCGDHVLFGIQELTRRMVDSERPIPWDRRDGAGQAPWDLSAIQPSRPAIVEALTRYEAFAEATAQNPASQGQQQPLYMDTGPRKKQR